MLTARVDERDKLAGLGPPAPTTTTATVQPQGAGARVRAVFRRADLGAARGDVIRAADVTLDVPQMLARIGNSGIDLTATEFDLLATLMRQPGRIFTRAQLLDAIRGEQVESFDRAVDAHVKNLRKKLEPDPRSPRYVLTVYGVGYKFAS
jgi:DNA-binding response OmpR family regulator